MVSFTATTAFLLAFASNAEASLRSQSHRRLSYELIAGYEVIRSILYRLYAFFWHQMYKYMVTHLHFLACIL